MKFLLAVLLIPLLIIPAFAESQTMSTDKGILDVNLTYNEISTNDLNKLVIEFINPTTKNTQVHVDYKITISKDGENIFQTPNLIHTSEGIINGLRVEFPEEGVYSMDIGIEGILFSPVDRETASFDIAVGDAYAQPTPNNDVPSIEENGGCLIATAAYGSEMAPQVQLLREIRDNTLFSTSSGTSFMSGFNTLYYSFAPTVADWERDNPMFKEIVKTVITPMLSTLSIMSLADEGSEADVLGLGISVIALNVGMYVGIPVFGILKLYQFRKN
jgi:hypothetical protein